MSISNYAENKLLDTIRGTAFSVSNAYLKLHTGDPGEDATANAATEATRQSVSFSAASGGSMASSGTVEWTNVSTTETVSHWSLWDASTGGNALWSGSLASSAALTAGDTFQITSLTITLD
tara:strand:- start:47 stop:409 length:363 start_codon:yes stop_codon:yes gene_type:complete